MKAEPDTSLSQLAEYRYDWVLPKDARQDRVFEVVGQAAVRSVLDGFHGCIFAYGQTGTGKSLTMFGGRGDDRGLLPRVSEALFADLDRHSGKCCVNLSYLEIYNEKLRDLLYPGLPEEAPALEIRQHAKHGIFVENLTSNVISSMQDLERLVDFGNKIRVVGCTNMNALSSRSHAVVLINVERVVDGDRGVAGSSRQRARLCAVDLAGSERMAQEGATQERMRESRNINTSLLALGNMISKLAQRNSRQQGAVHVPYRDSKLTHLISESLMGNCRTSMVACVSPASSALFTTESTVRFASSMKQIYTRPRQNKEVEGRLVDALRAEIANLRSQLSQKSLEGPPGLQEQLCTVQLVQQALDVSWERQQEQSLANDRRRRYTLAMLNLDNRSDGSGDPEGESTGTGGESHAAHGCAAALAAALDGVNGKGDKGETMLNSEGQRPYLSNLCDDVMLSGCLRYALPAGEAVLVGSDPRCRIRVTGLGVQPVTCRLTCDANNEVTLALAELREDSDDSDEESASTEGEEALGEVKEKVQDSEAETTGEENDDAYPVRGRLRLGSLFKSGVAEVQVNNERVWSDTVLAHGDHLRIGLTHRFQLVVPGSAGPRPDPGKEILDAGCAEEGSSGQALAKEYAAHLEARIGSSRAAGVFRRLRALRALVDEANLLTEELRGGLPNTLNGAPEGRLSFRAQLLTDVLSAREDPPLVVSLRLRSRERGVRGRDDSTLLAVWTEAKFECRLEVMRDLYQKVSDRSSLWGAEADDADPWADDDGTVPRARRTESPPQPVSSPARPRRRMKSFYMTVPGCLDDGVEETSDAGGAAELEAIYAFGSEASRKSSVGRVPSNPTTAAPATPRKRRAVVQLPAPEQSPESAPTPWTGKNVDTNSATDTSTALPGSEPRAATDKWTEEGSQPVSPSQNDIPPPSEALETAGELPGTSRCLDAWSSTVDGLPPENVAPSPRRAAVPPFKTAIPAVSVTLAEVPAVPAQPAPFVAAPFVEPAAAAAPPLTMPGGRSVSSNVANGPSAVATRGQRGPELSSAGGAAVAGRGAGTRAEAASASPPRKPRTAQAPTVAERRTLGGGENVCSPRQAFQRCTGCLRGFRQDALARHIKVCGALAKASATGARKEAVSSAEAPAARSSRGPAASVGGAVTKTRSAKI
eukprot:TRINITY_DN1853_c1_g3_i2.p1 TRINITY_DN1853_c1_g3~~TRINITY_DN1853_c1_g3_i2.p1  ORF type:complete len:1277 (+),score=261.58 TRINITY_DN1853_c1_g3_i2:353-3832(+)